jgi:GAF domain-containing protein
MSTWGGVLCHLRTGWLLDALQGKPGCLHIAFSRGVCGAAARSQKTQLVPDVHAFPGHIACAAR